MARYAGGGKTTVESCRCIDVLDWHRRGCLRSPAAVLMGVEAGWQAGGVDQCRDGTASRNPEIPKSLIR
jgi:hypothetical protein